MLSSGLSVEGIGHGLPLHSPGSLPNFLAAAAAAAQHRHMTFMEPFLKSDLRTLQQAPEFIRPLPKPPMTLPTKYNNVLANNSNGGTVGNGSSRPPQRYLLGKYHDPGGSGPVNLSQSKDTVSVPASVPASPEETTPPNFRNMYSQPSLFVPPPPPPPSIPMYLHAQGPFASVYAGHYTPLQLSREQSTLAPPPPPISPMEQFPNSQPAPNSPATAYSPPTLSSPSTKCPPTPTSKEMKKPFKLSATPGGKEGSLKHRILTRPESRVPKRPHTVTSESNVATTIVSTVPAPAALTASVSAPGAATIVSSSAFSHSGARTGATPNFSRGSLIQLASGELKRVEDMQAEDFINSAKKSSELCLDPSTVVRIDESPSNRTGATVLTITLSHGPTRSEVELESAAEQPYFVMGAGWASCHPDITYMKYGLECHKLQVGDVCISLTPRNPSHSSAVSERKCKKVKESSVKSEPGPPAVPTAPPALLGLPKQNVDLVNVANCKENVACKKRRWSAPDQFCEEDSASGVPLTGVNNRPLSNESSGVMQSLHTRLCVN